MPLWLRKASFLPILLLSLLATFVALGPPFFIKRIIDLLESDGLCRGVYISTLAIIVVAAVNSFSDWARVYLMAQLGQEIVLNLRVRLFEHLMRLPFSFFDRVKTGELISRIASDIETLSLFYSRAAIIVFGNLLFLLFLFLAALIWQWQMGLLFLAISPFIFHALTIYSKRVSPYVRKARKQSAELTAELRSILRGMDTIKGLGAETPLASSMEEKIGRLAHCRRESAEIVARWRHYPLAIVTCSCAACLGIGTGMVKEGSMSLGTLIAVTSLFSLLVRPIRQTGFMMAAILRAFASAERVFEVLDVQREDGDDGRRRELPPGEGNVEMEELGFGYGEEEKTLDGINLQFRAGELVALVGPSGAGKTTLAYLIPRFYRPREGKVRIDGVDIAGVSSSSLRKRVGIAFQDSFILNASLRSNVAWGAPDAGEEEVARALEQAQLGELLHDSSKGLDLLLGERGMTLSGGQRQRVALARVLLYDPQILILDEPTASLDQESEIKLHKAISKARKGRLTIVISHRLWAAQRANHIVLLDKGKLVAQAHSEEEEGKSAHNSLLETSELYRKLQNKKHEERN